MIKVIKAYARSLSSRFPIVLPFPRSLLLCSLYIMIAQAGHHSREWLGELIEKSYLGFPRTPTEAVMILFSPAQGAVFAPLALK